MKRTTTILLMIIVLAGLYSCKKELPDNNDTQEPAVKMKEMKVPESFTWKSFDNSDLTVNINSQTSLDNEPIFLYDDDFRIIERTIIKNGKAVFSAQIPVDNEFVTVFIPKTRSSLEIKDYQGKKNITLNTAKSGAKGISYAGSNSPDCNSGCTQTKTGYNFYMTINDGETVCLTGTLNGGLTMNGTSTIRICGTASISWINLNGSGTKTIIITSYGSLQTYSLNLNSGVTLVNYSSSCNINGSVNLSATLENYGTMTINSMNINGSGKLVNYGNITLIGSANVNDSLINYGSFSSAGSIQINTNKVKNYCKLVSNQSITVNSSLVNGGYIKAANTFLLNSGTITMEAASMISCSNLTLNGSISGGASLCAVKVTNYTLINGSGSITGLVNFCDSNGIEINNGTIASSVTYCQGYIPISSCNPEGIGTPSVTDSDNDGVADDVDDYPNDPTVAYRNYSPYSGYKIIAFEDLWPDLGDFDFNDLMIKTQVEYRSNAQNKLVDAQVTIILSAVGAGFHNGIGLQYLNSSNAQITGAISTVTGASVDANDNDCIKICDDVFDKQSTYYTNTTISKSAIPDTIRFSFTFNQSKNLEFSDINEDFYIFRKDDRGHEIHVADRPPTDAATSSLFGTGSDNTNASQGIYYKTSNNLPWGIELINISGIFHNPLEKIEIIDAYPLFQQWATSGGTQNQTWYNTPNPTKIFTNPN
jgi:LruC domain-containing protein